MRTLLKFVLLFFVAARAFGQGQVYFDNNVPGEVNAPVSRPDGTGAGLGVTAQLMLVMPNGDMVPIGPSTTFRTDSAAAAYYVNPVTLTVPGVLAGTVIEVRMVAFTGSDFQDSTLKGESNEIAVTLGGGVMLPPNLDGLDAFALTTAATAPTISTGPKDQTLAVGSKLVLAADVQGSTPLSYQWQKNDSNLPGATSASFTIAAVKESDSAEYRVVVHNDAGSATSREAAVTVLAPPQITAGPKNQNVTLGAPASFTVTASGSALKYQWQHNGADVPGATSASLKIPAVQAADAGTYLVHVSNGVADKTASALLTIVGGSFVQRVLPTAYAPGSKLLVTLNATPPAHIQSYLIEDQFPDGWTVGTIAAGGVFDAMNKKVKFGPVFADSTSSFTYELIPGSNVNFDAHFVGVAVADGLSSPITGDDTVHPLSLHPADSDPADQRLTGPEVTAYGAAWKKGQPWPQGPNPIPPAYVSRAGALWRGGEFYKVDTKAAAAPPLWWVNTSAPSGTAPQPGTSSVTLPADASGPFTSQLPHQYVPGMTLTVKSQVHPPHGTLSYVVEEEVPAGWVAANISDDGFFDETNHTVRWGLFTDDNERELSLDLSPPAEADLKIELTGVASFDGTDVPLSGQVDSVPSSKLEPPANHGKDGLDITLHGGAGKSFIIEVSTDLVTWTPLKTFENANGLLHFQESNSQLLRQKFYRAVNAP